MVSLPVFAPCPALGRPLALDPRLGGDRRVWLAGVFPPGAADVFRNNMLPPSILMMLVATLLSGYLPLLSPRFRRIVDAVPQH